MMTIFSNVVKLFLIDALNEQIKRSSEKDVPPPSFFVYLAPKRDTELALIKRVFLQQLITTINSLPDQPSDLETANVLLQGLYGCKTSVDTAASNKNHAHGTTEVLLEHLINFVKVFYKRISTLTLNDQADEKDTFSHFSTVIASYHAKRIMDSKIQPGILQSTLSNPAITSIIAFEKELDAFVSNTYLIARRNLEQQNTTDITHYSRIKAELGILCIQLLELTHDKMHAQYHLCFYASYLPRYLSDYLAHAQQATQSRIPSVSFTDALDEDDFSLFAIQQPTKEENNEEYEDALPVQAEEGQTDECPLVEHSRKRSLTTF